MKNVQIIDGALNCVYDVYAFTDDEFVQIFPEKGQDIEFIEDAIDRLGDELLSKILQPVWKRRINKKEICGIHGTIFYDLYFKKKYYPTKKDTEAIVMFD